MAARKKVGTKTAGWPAQVRDRIQTSMLINRLTGHAEGNVDLQPTQVKAIEILLRKTLPDLQAIEGNFSVHVRQEDALGSLE
jgi:hypothetical protein